VLLGLSIGPRHEPCQTSIDRLHIGLSGLSEFGVAVRLGCVAQGLMGLAQKVRNPNILRPKRCDRAEDIDHLLRIVLAGVDPSQCHPHVDRGLARCDPWFEELDDLIDTIQVKQCRTKHADRIEILRVALDESLQGQDGSLRIAR